MNAFNRFCYEMTIVVRFFFACLRFLQNKCKRVSQEEREKRLHICHDCGYEKDYRCRECGCWTLLKTLCYSEKCPKGYW